MLRFFPMESTVASASTNITKKTCTAQEAAAAQRFRLNFCVPGEKFSHRFLQCWTELLNWAKNTNIDIYFYNAQGSNISHVRELLLLGDINGDKNQKPFKGEPYSYVLFCDSDQVFTPKDVETLMLANKPVISGCIKMLDGNYAQGWYEPEQFRKEKFTRRLIPEIIDNTDQPIRCSLIGCGFCLIRYGVIEKIEFPWFKPIDYGNPMAGYMGEDMSFFTRIRQAGVELWVHPLVRIGHEKEVVI